MNSSHQWQVDPLWRPRQWVPVGPFGSQTLVGVDLLQISDAIVHAVQTIRRARAETAAARDVQQTIREYCEVQPNGGAGIQICGKPPAVR